jgi:hypothetical protein
MPKSGQVWNRDFLIDHVLFEVWEPWARPFRTSSWPSAELYSLECAKASREVSPPLSPLQFVEKPKKSRRKKRSSVDLAGLYDGSIALRGEVPCLAESYHDLFNAIVFCAFPRAKRALHARQFRAQKRWLESSGALEPHAMPRLPGARTREQDALTIFDEGGTLLLFTESAHRAWSTTATRMLLEAFSPGHVLPLLFGHALLEHLMEGHQAVRSSALVLVCPDSVQPLRTEKEIRALFDWADQRLADLLENEAEFQAPGAHAIFEFTGGELFVGPSAALK